MRWEEELFAVLDELEQQAEGLYAAERDLEVADRGRAEYHQVTLASRLMASLGSGVGLDVSGVGVVRGSVRRVGADWCLLSGPGQDWVVRLDAVRVVHDASTRSVPEVAWSPVHRLGWASALRRIAEAGERCVVHLVDGTSHDGRVRRVGQDFVETSVGEGREVLLAYAAIAAIQSRDGA